MQESVSSGQGAWGKLGEGQVMLVLGEAKGQAEFEVQRTDVCPGLNVICQTNARARAVTVEATGYNLAG